jgi:hypothetical protein
MVSLLGRLLGRDMAKGRGRGRARSGGEATGPSHDKASLARMEARTLMAARRSLDMLRVGDEDERDGRGGRGREGRRGRTLRGAGQNEARGETRAGARGPRL